MSTDLQRNHRISLIFLNDSASTLRDWLPWIYPKGRKAVGLSLQTHQGWVEMRPYPDSGFEIDHNTVVTRSSGLWLQGTMSPRACLRDVALARLLMGWRFWHVATPRVWLYRALSAVVLGTVASSAGYGEQTSMLAALVPFAIPSPLTPKGLYQYAVRRDFVPPALRPDTKASVKSPIFNPLKVKTDEG